MAISLGVALLVFSMFLSGEKAPLDPVEGK
jgi:hypothetical protein